MLRTRFSEYIRAITGKKNNGEDIQEEIFQKYRDTAVYQHFRKCGLECIQIQAIDNSVNNINLLRLENYYMQNFNTLGGLNYQLNYVPPEALAQPLVPSCKKLNGKQNKSLFEFIQAKKEAELKKLAQEKAQKELGPMKQLQLQVLELNSIKDQLTQEKEELEIKLKVASQQIDNLIVERDEYKKQISDFKKIMSSESQLHTVEEGDAEEFDDMMEQLLEGDRANRNEGTQNMETDDNINDSQSS